MNINIWLIIILFILFISLHLYNNYYKSDFIIKYNDNKYFEKFLHKNIITNLINNNQRKKPISIKNNILFVTYDNRSDLDYIKIHNSNITKYAKYYNYKYKFITSCSQRTYWCKIHIVNHALKTDKYDYVVWLDSDTVIKNMSIDIGDILNNFSSDIYIGLDNNLKYDLTNAGIFIIKNNIIGNSFIEDCLLYEKNIFYNIDQNYTKFTWAGAYYEQAAMNILIADKYSKYTTVLTNDIIFNYFKCTNNVFIMHLYASTPSDRKQCFINNY